MDDDSRVEALYYGIAFPDGEPNLNDARTVSVLRARDDGDEAGARSMMKALREAEPTDQWIEAFDIWLSHCHHPAQAAIDRLAAIVRDHPRLAMPRAWLGRLLVLTGDLGGADTVLSDVSGGRDWRPSLVVARAQLLVARKEYAGAMRSLRDVRDRTQTPPVSLLTFEMIVATAAKDRADFEAAYRKRATVVGGRAFNGVPWLWVSLVPRFHLVFAASFFIGAVFNLWALELLALACFLGYMALHAHVLRNRRLIRRNIVILVTTVAFGVMFAIAYRAFGY
ncbi:MAG: hypothetical protein ABI635_04760 [Actinomycetota bacterium]